MLNGSHLFRFSEILKSFSEENTLFDLWLVLFDSQGREFQRIVYEQYSSGTGELFVVIFVSFMVRSYLNFYFSMI